MFSETRISKVNYLLERGLDVSVIRQKVIADNIANVDTPHFKRSDVCFESQLRRALNSEKPLKPAYLTNKKHIAFDRKIDFKSVRPKINIDFDTNYGNNKNNVDIEKEMANATKNSMRYNAMVQRLSQNYRMIAIAMQ